MEEIETELICARRNERDDRALIVQLEELLQLARRLAARLGRDVTVFDLMDPACRPHEWGRRSQLARLLRRRPDR